MTMVWRTVSVILILQLLLLPPEPAEAQEANREDEVRAAVAEFGRAFVEADVPRLRGRLTEGYVHVNGGSGNVLNRDQWLDWVASRRAELDSGELVIDDYRVGDVTVTIYDEAAVVTGIVESNGRRKGAPFSSRIRFTNVWINRDGTWLRAAFHDSAL